MSVSAEIERFIVTELTQGRGIAEIDPSENLLSTGIVDSHGVTELVGFLEARYGISVADDDLTPENFETIAGIEAFVESKRNGEA